MNRLSLPSTLLAAIVVAGASLPATDAAAQVVIPAPPLPPAPPVAIIVAPPPAFVATAQPVYYEGHASYWYGNRWVWRDVHGWHGYDREPVYLHEHRVHGPPARWHYEHRR